MSLKMAGLASMMALAFVVGPAVADTNDEVVANIPFTFVAAGKVQEAGAYGLRIDVEQETIELVPPKGSGEVIPVVTRLAAPEGRSGGGRLVFDKQGNTYTLSEVWLPRADGFLVHATKGTHAHETTPLAKKAL